MFVADKNPRTFYFPAEMANHQAIALLKKHGSIAEVLKAQGIKKPTKEQTDYFWLKVCEERYKYDFEFFAVCCVTIRDKLTSLDIPFKLNLGQRRLLAQIEKQRKKNTPIRIQVLKSRQWGCSTFVQIYMKWIQFVHKINWNSVVCAHVKDAAINVRAMYENSIKQMPGIDGVSFSIKSFQQTQNIKEVPERGCRITVGTALEPDSVRSQDVKMVHFSEMAHYPATLGNNPELLETSIVSSVPEIPYTMIVRESTANGEGDYFFDQWQKAKKEETVYEPVFVEWYLIDMYEKPFAGEYTLENGRTKKGTVSGFIGTLSEYEKNLWKNHPLCTLENLNWRRREAAKMPSETKMKQEFPSDDIEAFQASGSPVFNAEHIEALRADCYEPMAVGRLIADCDPNLAVIEPKRRKEILQNIRFEEDRQATDFVLNGTAAEKLKWGMNRLQVWAEPDLSKKIKRRYIVVFDPQKGLSDSADYGVIKVIDRYYRMKGGKSEIAAMFYGRLDKDISIWVAAQIAKWYDNALLVVESNIYDSDNNRIDDTEFIFNTIADYYHNLYAEFTPADQIEVGAPKKWGFRMDRNSKPAIISNYKAVIRERGYIERDAGTLDEARTFEEKKNGATGAKDKHKDDRIIATMIGLFVDYLLPLPEEVKPDVKEVEVMRTAW